MSWSNIKDFIFVAAFLLLISMPGIIRLTGWNIGYEISENRSKAQMPKFDPTHLRRSANRFETYYNDNFGFRGMFLLFNKAMRYFVLRTPGTDSVIIGKNGWHFYRQQPNLHELRNEKLFTEEQLRRWAKMLQMRSNYAREHGADYLFVIAPDSKSIFPEQLPGWMPPPNPRSRTDQLFEYLAAHTDVQFLDLRPLFRERKNEQIYYRTDTHWTDLGAYYAYEAILARLKEMRPEFSKHLGPLPLSYFYVVPKTFSGDLTTMLGLKGLVKEETISLVPHTVWQATLREGKYSEHNFVTDNRHRPDGPKLLVFRDSFATAMQAPLAEHFSTVRYRWGYAFERRYIVRDHPDIVLQLMVERMLGQLDPQGNS